MTSSKIETTIRNEDIKSLTRLITNINIKLQYQGEYGCTPLHIAVIMKTSTQFIRTLLKCNADVNAQNNNLETPLHFASETNAEIVKLLYNYGAEVNAKDVWGMTPFCQAIETPNNFEIVKFLIQQGADVNAYDENGMTHLHRICSKTTNSRSAKSNTEIAKLLIEHGADKNAKDTEGYTPLHLACKNPEYVGITKKLIEFGAELNVITNDGMTPLHNACSVPNNIENVKVLLDNDADINAIGRDKTTPLFWTLYSSGWSENVEFLLKRGADLNGIFDIKTALYFVLRDKHSERVKTLLEYGADVNFHPNLIDEICDKSDSLTLNLIREHLIRLKSLGLASEETFNNWRFPIEPDSKELRKFEEACHKEAEKLRKLIFLNWNFSFYDMLTKNLDEVAVFLNVDEIREKLDQIDFKRFPIFSGYLKARTRKITKLTNLSTQNYRSLQIISNSLPDIAVKQIFTLLSKRDLENLNLVYALGKEKRVINSSKYSWNNSLLAWINSTTKWFRTKLAWN